MNSRVRGLLAGIACSLAIPASATEQGPVPSAAAILADLVEAERAFTQGSTGTPARSALLAMLDDDVVAFVVPVPGLAEGRVEAEKLIATAFPTQDETLNWATVRFGVSADGLHGFSYGFMDRAAAGKPPQLGKYVAYWVKRAAGWRVAAFKWVPREAGAVQTVQRPPAVPSGTFRGVADAAFLEAARQSLDATERQFSDEAQVIGLGPAFRKFGSADAVNVGGGADFTYGADAIGDAVSDPAAPNSSPLKWAPDGVIVASSGDLGMTYGYLQRNGLVPAGRLARIPFFTVWRRAGPEQPWRYVAE